jgi:hypothetical protein
MDSCFQISEINGFQVPCIYTIIRRRLDFPLRQEKAENCTQPGATRIELTHNTFTTFQHTNQKPFIEANSGEWIMNTE